MIICGKFSMASKSKYSEKDTNISSTGTFAYDSEDHQPIEKEYDVNIGTNTSKTTKILYPRKTFETETTTEKHRESIANQKYDAEAKYQIKKPERKILRAKLIND